MAALTEIEFIAAPDHWYQLRQLNCSHRDLSFQISPGFQFQDWIRAAQATGRLVMQTQASAKRWYVVGEVSSLIDDVAGVLEYVAAEEQSQELQRIRTRLHSWLGEDAEQLSDYAVAFADLQLRELLADEARSASDVWSDQTVAIDPRASVEQVIAMLRDSLVTVPQPEATPAAPQTAAASIDSPLSAALRKPGSPSRDEREVG